jgi:hypothetical protein
MYPLFQIWSIEVDHNELEIALTIANHLIHIDVQADWNDWLRLHQHINWIKNAYKSDSTPKPPYQLEPSNESPYSFELPF